MAPIVMVNLARIGHGDGGALHQAALLRRFLERGRRAQMITPQRGRGAAVDADLLPAIRFSPSVEKLGWPTSLDGLLQLWPILRARLGGAGVLYVRANLFTLAQVVLARMLLMRVVVEHNSWTAGERRARGGGRVAAWLERLSQVWSARLAHGSRCVTAGIADLLAAHGVARTRLHVIGNGTNIARWRPQSADAGTVAPLQLGFIGLLSPWQGVATALKALAVARRHAAFELTVVGDGPELNKLCALAATLEIEPWVHFSGYVEPSAAPAAVAAFDLALAPFTRARNEQIGLAPIKLRDYAAAGKPVIAARLPGIIELEAAGWLRTHEPDDAEDLARVIVEMHSLDADQLAQMRTRARHYAEEHFDWNRIADQVIELC